MCNENSVAVNYYNNVTSVLVARGIGYLLGMHHEEGYYYDTTTPACDCLGDDCIFYASAYCIQKQWTDRTLNDFKTFKQDKDINCLRQKLPSNVRCKSGSRCSFEEGIWRPMLIY